MDDDRIDDLTRFLAASRRGALRTLAGSAGELLAVRRRFPDLHAGRQRHLLR
jgi:hypothetical protein